MKAKFISSSRMQKAFISLLILSILISISSLLILRGLLKSNEEIIERETEDFINIITLKSDFESNVASFRGFLITGKPDMLERSNDAHKRFSSRLNTLLHTLGNGAEVEALDALKKANEKYIEKIQFTINLKKSKVPFEKIENYFESETQPLRLEKLALLNTMLKEEKVELDKFKTIMALKSRNIFLVIVTTTSISLLLVLFLVFLISNQITSLYKTACKSAEELQLTVNGLRQVNHNLEQFTATAAHDLKSPLRTVSMYVELLSAGIQESDRKDFEKAINFIVGSTKRMRLLIDDLLNYSMMSNIEIKTASISVKAVVESVIDNLQKDIEESRARIEYNPLPVIVAEQRLLFALFQNLISNAIKYRAGSSLQIKITAKDKADFWEFCVQDNGIGFDMSRAESIFRPFERLVDTNTVPGTGLGLAICKKILERHKGKIWAISESGKGTAFFFTIPKSLKHKLGHTASQSKP